MIDRIDAVVRGDRMPWTEIAGIMADVEAGEVWRQFGARSFTSWIEGIAPRWRLSAVVLWRYRTVWKQLPMLLEALEDAGVPEPVDIGSILDPDSIDLLGKIARELGRAAFADLATRALSGRSSRAELRRIWSHRKAARDRGGYVADASRKESDEERAFASELVGVLQAGDLDWLADGTRLIRLVRGASLPTETSYAVGPQVTVVCTASRLPEAGLHYLHYSAIPDRKAARLLGRYVPYYDSCWVVARDPDATGPRPPGFGLLQLSGGNLSLLEQAQSNAAGARSGETAKVLLAM